MHGNVWEAILAIGQNNWVVLTPLSRRCLFLSLNFFGWPRFWHNLVSLLLLCALDNSFRILLIFCLTPLLVTMLQHCTAAYLEPESHTLWFSYFGSISCLTASTRHKLSQFFSIWFWATIFIELSAQAGEFSHLFELVSPDVMFISVFLFVISCTSVLSMLILVPIFVLSLSMPSTTACRWCLFSATAALSTTPASTPFSAFAIQ